MNHNEIKGFTFTEVNRIIQSASWHQLSGGDIVSFEQSEDGEFFFMDYVRSRMVWNVHGKNDVLPHWWHPV